jgi:site-specific DNA-methyltransferase (adenine-specific)
VVDYQTEEGKTWDGWGTCLKPSYEPIIVARKPCEGSTTDNVLKYGVGGLNIDGCRIPTDDYLYQHGNSNGTVGGFSVGVFAKAEKGENASTRLGRFPSNVILTYDETDKDEVCGGMPSGDRNGSIAKNYDMHNMVYGDYGKCNTFEAYEDSGSAARYFYCAKATLRDREEGCENLEDQMFHRVNSGGLENEERFKPVPRKNVHPTVKPTMLMQYLVRLVTPKGGTVLDPFNGSGSTGKGAMYENFDYGSGYKYIGIELTDTYLPIAKARIENADKTLAAEKERLSFEFSDTVERVEETGEDEDW